jgi:hypothetical protein
MEVGQYALFQLERMWCVRQSGEWIFFKYKKKSFSGAADDRFNMHYSQKS